MDAQLPNLDDLTRQYSQSESDQVRALNAPKPATDYSMVWILAVIATIIVFLAVNAVLTRQSIQIEQLNQAVSELQTNQAR